MLRIGELQEVMKDISRKQRDEDRVSTEMDNFDGYKKKKKKSDFWLCVQ